MNKLVKYAAVTLIFFLIGIVAASLVERWIYPNQGEIILEVYLQNTVDNTAFTNGTTIDWGEVTPGNSYYVILNCTNIGTEPFTVSVTAQINNENLTLAWASNNTLLQPTDSVEDDLILSVDPLATATPFSFDIYVNADDGT